MFGAAGGQHGGRRAHLGVTNSRLKSQLSHSFTLNNLLDLAEVPHFKNKTNNVTIVTSIDKKPHTVLCTVPSIM